MSKTVKDVISELRSGTINFDDEAEELISHLLIEAKIEVADKYLAYRAASDTESEAIQWLDFQRTELRSTLKRKDT